MDAIDLVGPRDRAGIYVQRPAAQAGHALRLVQQGLAGPQGLLGAHALGDIEDAHEGRRLTDEV